MTSNEQINNKFILKLFNKRHTREPLEKNIQEKKLYLARIKAILSSHLNIFKENNNIPDEYQKEMYDDNFYCIHKCPRPLIHS